MPQLLKMPHSLLSALSQPLPPCPDVIIVQLESRNHDLFLTAFTLQHLEMTKHADSGIDFRIKKGHRRILRPHSATDRSAQWRATTRGDFLLQVIDLWEDVSHSGNLCIWYTVCFCTLFLAVHTIPTRILYNITLDRFIVLQWHVWRVMNNPFSDCFADTQTQSRAGCRFPKQNSPVNESRTPERVGVPLTRTMSFCWMQKLVKMSI